MKTKAEIENEIKSLRDKYYRGIPCGRNHSHWYYDENKKLLKKEIPCDFEHMCGHCKSQLTQRVERRLINQLNWVLEGSYEPEDETKGN